MFVFSATGTARKKMKNIEPGQEVPFIVYISFKDQFGAEKLCHLYLLRAGFTDIVIEKTKAIEDKLLKDKRVLMSDKRLRDAVEHGYHIQVFDAH